LKRVVVDLFCGCGGFACGVHQAGHEVVLSVDFWKDALDVHAANHPGSEHLLLELGPEAEDILIAAIERAVAGRPWHLHGSPPCQNLSNANAKADTDEGMRLVLWFLDLVERLQPDSWSMEQVQPVIKHLPVGTPVRVLNSADFGVPQTRKRAFCGRTWVANPTHAGRWVSWLEALPHLAEEAATHLNAGRSDVGGIDPKTGKKAGGSGPLRRDAEQPSFTITSAPLLLEGYKRRNPIIEKGKVVGSEPGRDCREPDQPSFTVATKPLAVFLENGANPDETTPRSADQPEPTVTTKAGTHLRLNTVACINPGAKGATADSRSQRGTRFESDRPVGVIGHHPVALEKVRYLKAWEGAVLQGFPPDYDWSPAKKGDLWTMIGNAVCPPVAAAVMLGTERRGESLFDWVPAPDEAVA